MVIPAPVEDVNSDGKANLDIRSSVKYGKELLNEQLIPPRYYVPGKNLDGRREKNKVEQNRGKKCSINAFMIKKNQQRFVVQNDMTNRKKSKKPSNYLYSTRSVFTFLHCLKEMIM